MKTEITKSRGWWKHLLLLCVTLLGVVGFATAAPNYPFPNNYPYPNGTIYTGSDVQTKIQGLYSSWKALYYEESSNGQEARIKFVSGGDNGSTSVSEGIAYGMLITVYMDNSTNNTQGMFDKLWKYYQNNSNERGVMNWKVTGFTHQVAPPTSGNSNGATDADLDAAQALLMAYKQWGKESYLTDAQKLIQNLWAYEVEKSDYHLKPGDAFDSYSNPCYFITNAMRLFDQVKTLQKWSNSWDWGKVVSKCYQIMSASANSTTGLIPDWCTHSGGYLSGLIDGKFESIFGYDAARIPWRMAHAYAWYGDSEAKAFASKITDWAKQKYPSPNDIVDGFYLNGNPGDGRTPFTGSLSSWGTSKNPTFKAGLSIGSMVDSKYNSYRDLCWQYGAATESYGAYYTHTTQLLYMLCLTGNMPNFWDMNPVFLSAETNSAGTAIVANFSKPISQASASNSTGKFTVTTYPTAEDAKNKTNGSTISVSSASVSSKVVTLNLASEITNPYIFLTYNGTTLKGTDESEAATFADKEVKNVITNMEPYPIARYSNQTGNEIYIQWSKDVKKESAVASAFTVKVDGVAKGTPSIAYYVDDEGIENKSILALKWTESIIISPMASVTVSYTGGLTSTSGTRQAKPFDNAPVQNFYGAESCMNLYDFGENTGTERWTAILSDQGNQPSEVKKDGSVNDKVLFYNAAKGDERLIYALNVANQTDLGTWLKLLKSEDSRLVGRIYVESLGTAGEGLALFLLSEDAAAPGYHKNNAAFPIKNLKTGQWFEFDIPLTEDNGWYYNTYDADVVYQALWLSTWAKNSDGGYGETPSGTFKVYVDYLHICPKKSDVVAERGKVSYDGKQVELKFSTLMKIPTSTTDIKIMEGSTSHAVTSIEAKDGDATKLIFNLETPIEAKYDPGLIERDEDGKIITDRNTPITAVMTTSSTNVKAMDGRPASAFEISLTNLTGMTTSTGWYDHFNDATDYVTNNISTDGTYVSSSEKAGSSQLDVTWDGSETWAGSMVLSTIGAGYVMDLTENATCEFKVKANQELSGFYRIDTKDYFGTEKEGKVKPITIGTSYKTISLNLAMAGLEKSSIAQVTFRFLKQEGTQANGYVPTLMNGTLSFDYISIGKPLYLYDFSPAEVLNTSEGIDEDSYFTVKSSMDGIIFTVDQSVSPQYSALSAAVALGKGVSAECTAGTATTINMEGMGYGYFTTYVYDPNTGSVSAKYGCQVKDVTPPVFTNYYGKKTIARDGTLNFTVDEDATVYLVPVRATVTTYAQIIESSPIDHWTVNGGETFAVDLSKVDIEPGESYKLVAIDKSYNVSKTAPTSGGIEILLPELAFTVDESNVTIGTIIKILSTKGRPTTGYLVLADDDEVYYETMISEPEEHAVLTIDINTYGTTQLKTDLLNITEETDFYLYLLDGEKEDLVGPVLITVSLGTYELTSVTTSLNNVLLKCDTPKDVEVSFEEKRYPDQRLTFSGGEEYFDVSYDETQNSNGTGTITLTGKKDTGGEPVVLTITSAADKTIKTTLNVTVNILATDIVINDAPATVPQGAEIPLDVVVEPAGAVSASNAKILWTTSDGSMATVTDGVLTVKEDSELGQVTLTATISSGCSGKITKSFTTNVTAASVTAVKVAKRNDPSYVSEYIWEIENLGKTSTLALDLEILPNASNNEDAQLVAISSDEEIVTISSALKWNSTNEMWRMTVKYMATKQGQATVKISSVENPLAYATVVVKAGEAACETAAPTSSEVSDVTICEGGNATLAATFSGSAEAVWYSAASGGSALYTGNSYATGKTAADTYTYYVAKNDGCESSSRTPVTLTITAKPTATLGTIESAYCITTESVTLSATPSAGTGTWSGTGVTGSTFSPATAGAGTHTVTYTIGETGCQNVYTKDITVKTEPSVALTVNKTMCSNDKPQLLSAEPSTGQWSGTGLTGASFNPATAGEGTHTVTYAYSDGTCMVKKTEEITVTENPTPVISGLEAAYCANAADVTLSAAPEGGSFKVNDVAATKFSPANAAAENTITYTVAVKGCEGTATKTVAVNALPSIDLSEVSTSACAGQEITLAPTDGTWTGTGVNGTKFSSSTAGEYELTYSVSENGCSASKDVTITVTKATAPTASPVTVALGEEVPALTASGSGTIKWYKSADGESVSTGESYVPDNASTAADKVFTYYVTNTDAGCESEKVAVTLTVTGCTVTAPSVAAVDAICEGEDFPELEATGTESSFAWYDAITDGTPIAATAKFTPTAAGTYYAAQASAECEGPRTSVVVEVKAKPAAPTATGASSCAGADLVAMTTVETANWYADKAAAAVATGVKTYTPTSLSETTTFYVNQVVNGCASDFADVVYTIKDIPAKPEVATSVACLGNTDDYNVEVKNPAASATLQWYDENKAPKGTDAKQAVSGVTSAKDYTYTVTQTVDGCTSDAAQATLTVKALPEPVITLDARYALSISTETPLSANPAGGSFTLDGAPATTFTPSTMTEGTHAVVYTYTDGDGCTGTANATFEVFDSSDPAVESITLNSTEETLAVDGTVKLVATILPVEGTDNKAVLWTSSDERVATVAQDGTVTAVSVGKATITALATYKPGDKSATCAVTVEAKVVPVESASFKDGYKTTADAGEEIDLSSYVTYYPPEPTGVKITWSVSPASAGTITEDGKFTAGTVTKNTSVTITAIVSAGGVSEEAEAEIVVLKAPVPVTAIEVSVPAQLEANSTYQAEVRFPQEDPDDKNVTWSISNGNATIDQYGSIKVTGEAGSSFDVIATSANGVEGRATVEIIAEIIPVESASITIPTGENVVMESGTLDLGQYLSFDPPTASIKTIEWLCPSQLVDINPTTGVVTGKSLGGNKVEKEVSIQVRVTSLDGEQVSASTTIILKKDPKYVSKIEIENALSLEEGSIYQFTAEVSAADDRSITWSIKSGKGGTINPQTGELEITGSEGDKFVVVATANDANAVESNECTVTVLKKTIPVQEITLSVSSVEIMAGSGNQTINISFLPEGTTQTKYTVISNSSKISYVDDENGHITITGNQGGDAILTIKSWDNPTIIKTINVKVTELVKYINVTGTSILNVGDKVNFAASVGESTATNKAVTWSSSDPSVASVDAKGLVTAMKAGMVEIIATASDGSDIKGSTYVTVSVVPVTRVSATASLELEIDQTATIKPTIEPYNATYKSVVYSSNDESVATVSSDGVVTAVGVGETTITITAPGDGTAPISTTTIVKVTPVRADMTYLGILIFNDQWGAYAINAKIAAKELIVGWGRGQISPLVNNEFQAAAIEANNIYWLEETVGTFPTQEEVDAAAQRLYKAIVAMGMKDVEKPEAIDDVASVDAKVFPTKVTSFVTIEADNMVSVKIVSITGKVVAQEMAAGDEIEINTSMFAQGVYRVIIETENGTVVKGFVK